jgi:hypothetical protein
MVTVPNLVPGAVGVNVITMEQLAPAPSELPQVFESEKSPVGVMVRFKAVELLLVSVTDCVALG